MSPTSTIEHTFEDDTGVQHALELEVDFVEGTPGTHWDPPYPGYIEAMRLVVDGEEVTDLTGWQWQIDEMLAKPLPKPDIPEDP